MKLGIICRIFPCTFYLWQRGAERDCSELSLGWPNRVMKRERSIWNVDLMVLNLIQTLFDFSKNLSFITSKKAYRWSYASVLTIFLTSRNADSQKINSVICIDIFRYWNLFPRIYSLHFFDKDLNQKLQTFGGVSDCRVVVFVRWIGVLIVPEHARRLLVLNYLDF